MESKELVKCFIEYLEKVNSRENLDEKSKKQVAYALNMCTVSVSQIVDYNDINILEQEYEAILNNLNLEHIPKDEALLNILKQLLDTITYFRIQEGDKAMIEKEYQHNIENAIWSAVPNFGFIIAGGNPLTMAVSLASQVGIGYMNYRRNKAEYAFIKEKQNWQLQRTAIEQFNGLRRELFSTAWRLADTYKFPDEYRLTEKQIKQYNQILIDQDEIRKYERLESIKNSFEAYPPFWYFIGNSANYIAGNEDFDLSNETRDYYRKNAIKYFEKYEEINELNLLREDQIASSCYLEHIDILLLDYKTNIEKIKILLEKAIVSSGYSNDIIELCAINYLKINDDKSASKYLRILVNEDYNKIINGQLLSGIYVKNLNRKDYELLATRVDINYLYPMPKSDDYDENELNAEFGRNLKENLKLKYKLMFENLLQKYSVEWNKLTSIFDLSKKYEDNFFLDSGKAISLRRDAARQIFFNEDKSKKNYFVNRILESNYELGYLDILNKLCDGLFNFGIFKNLQIIEEVEKEIKNQILDRKDVINKLKEISEPEDFSFDLYNLLQKITLRSIVGRSFNALTVYANSIIEKANINEIYLMEANLRKFCIDQKIEEPEIIINKSNFGNSFNESQERFSEELFGRIAIVARKNAKFLSDMAKFVKEKFNSINLKDNSLSIYFIGDEEFNTIFSDKNFDTYEAVQSHAILFLKDNSKVKVDLIFTTKGIIHLVKGEVKNLTPYNEIELRDNQIILYRKFKYSTSAIDTLFLFNLIKELGRKFIVGIEDKIEYVTDEVTVNMFVDWFKSNKNSMSDDVTRIIAIPTKDDLEHLGYKLEEELYKDRHLMQYYYDNKTNELLDIRIICYENIDSNFEKTLLEKNGFLKISNK